MRVLFVTHNVPRHAGDAAGSFVLRLAVALRAVGVDVDVLAPGAPGLSGHDVIEGVPIERVRYADESRMTLAYTGTMAEEVRASWSGRVALLGLLWHMRRAVRRRARDAVVAGKPYDIVHAHWWFPAGLIAFGAGIGKHAGMPLVVTMHGSDVRLAQGIRPSHAVMRRVLGRARVVTSVSRWLADAARAIVPKCDVVVAPMPVDVSAFSAPPVGEVRHGILFVGRLNEQKGLADLLEAFAGIPGDVRLDIVGDGPDAPALRERAGNLGISSRVRWHGPVAMRDLVPMYQHASVVAIPSREEGLGLVAVEAQLCGARVVAYASGGLPEIVRGESGGVLVPAGNVSALATALEQLLGHGDERRDELAPREAMLQTFSPDAVARRYHALYAKAVA